MARKWRKGRIHVGSLTVESAHYIAGYVTKKMTDADDRRLEGRPPEFARMSLKPGIGAGAVSDIASTVLTHDLSVDGDVPVTLRSGGKVKPLGRYLVRRLRKECGRAEGAPASKLAASEELQEVRSRAEIVEKGGVAEALSANDDVKVARQEFYVHLKRRKCRETE